jgi:hypothetical protein
MTDLNKYKGQFIQGEPPKPKTVKDSGNAFYSNKLPVQSSKFNYKGWIPPHKGAI